MRKPWRDTHLFSFLPDCSQFCLSLTHRLVDTESATVTALTHWPALQHQTDFTCLGIEVHVHVFQHAPILRFVCLCLSLPESQPGLVHFDIQVGISFVSAALVDVLTFFDETGRFTQASMQDIKKSHFLKISRILPNIHLKTCWKSRPKYLNIIMIVFILTNDYAFHHSVLQEF